MAFPFATIFLALMYTFFFFLVDHYAYFFSSVSRIPLFPVALRHTRISFPFFPVMISGRVFFPSYNTFWLIAGMFYVLFVYFSLKCVPYRLHKILFFRYNILWMVFFLSLNAMSWRCSADVFVWMQSLSSRHLYTKKRKCCNHCVWLRVQSALIWAN